MIKAVTLQAEYRRSLNRINSGYGKRFSVIDGDGFLNEAIDIVFENIAQKFETNTLSRNHLRQLEVKNQKASCTKVDDNICKITYPDNLYMLTRQWIIACKDGCDIDRTLELFIIQSSDITKTLKDPQWKPSFQWEEALAEEAGDDLYIYHNCDFNVKEVGYSYLRKPNHIATPSLADCDYINEKGETITSDVDFELDSTFFWRKVVQIAVLNSLLAIGEAQDYQLRLNNIMALDRVFIQ